jgi:tripartite-type tricarboxylate transporter receptor subunit TctC
MPQPVITLLNKTVNDILPLIEAQLVNEGADPVGGSPEQFGKFTEDEYRKWKAVVQASGAVAQ